MTFAYRREVAAPRDLVFATWNDCRHLEHFWGPAGASVFHCETDPRPDGVFLYGLRFEDGREMWGKWIFQDVDSPNRIEVITCFCDAAGNPVRHPMAPTWPLMTRSVMLFHDREGRTEIKVTAEPWQATAEEISTFQDASTGMKAGYDGTMSAYEVYLAGR